MREIKFRGKSVEDGHWVYGYYVHLTDYFRDREIHRIYNGLSDSCPSVKDKYDFFPDTEEVDEETISQFTGLYDKNGREIYEGDIVHLDTWKPDAMLISFIEGAFCLTDVNGNYLGDIHYIHHAEIEQCTVLSNIYDNPEPMKRGQE